MFAESEHGHAHPHGTGVRWLDMVVAVSVVLISVLSIAISIRHGKTMEQMVKENEKMVAASTLPWLTEYGAQFDPVTRTPMVRLVIANGGVGPALVDWFEVRYKGTAYSSVGQLLKACCESALPGENKPDGVFYSNVTGFIIPAKESLNFLDVRSEASRELVSAVNKARSDMSFRVCYCSVLNECWESDLRQGRPKPVEACRAPEGAVVW